ncbi:MAG: adenylate/guanylate cyclase domain-containing protein [Dehalococcoidia bacterium]
MEYSFAGAPVVVGRDAACDIQVPSQYVSRRHIRISPGETEDELTITDLGGRNPVLVNGQQITGSARLLTGDTITIADTFIDIVGDEVSTGTIVFMPKAAAPAPANRSATAPRPGTSPGGIHSVWQGQNLGPGGTLTIMFTDLEQSTAMVSEQGEREAYKVINAHNIILRERFREFRGYEAKRMGDGFLVLFASARDALNCAVAIQRRLSEAADGPYGQIRVRIGLHVGEVLWDENDIFGSAVNFAARVSAEAKGGEILISALMREVVTASGEFDFGEARSSNLKGFKGTHTLTVLSWDQVDETGST